MRLPNSFIRTIQDVFEETGRLWLSELPALAAEASSRWGLTDVQPVPNLSYNFVAFAKRGGDDVILKIGVPDREFLSEMAALQFFNGAGMCRLLDHDAERYLLLLERLKPGTLLAEIKNDDERTHIAVDVMQRLWHPLPAQNNGDFIRLSDWFAALSQIRPHFGGGTGPFPEDLLGRVEASLPVLFTAEPRLLHGDFHHFNVLSSERGWLAIDPKGVIGPAGYEIGPLMLNPWNNSMDRTSFRVQTSRRVDILHERLGWGREVILAWSLAHAILSAWWDHPHGDWGYALRCADVFAGLK